MFQIVLYANSSIFSRLDNIRLVSHHYIISIPYFVIQIPNYCVMANRRNNRRRGNLRANRTGRLKRMVNKTVLGTRIIPSADPPEYTAGPWWPLTIVDSVSADTTYTGVKLHQGILATLNLTDYKKASTALTFKFRVVSVRAWGLDKQPIQLAVTETHGTTANWVKEMNDFGTPLTYSRLGWRFGDAFIHRVFTSEDKQEVFQVAQSGSTNKILVYIQVMIRVPNAPEPALVRNLAWSSQDPNAMENFEHLSMTC